MRAKRGLSLKGSAYRMFQFGQRVLHEMSAKLLKRGGAAVPFCMLKPQQAPERRGHERKRTPCRKLFAAKDLRSRIR